MNSVLGDFLSFCRQYKKCEFILSSENQKSNDTVGFEMRFIDYVVDTVSSTLVLKNGDDSLLYIRGIYSARRSCKSVLGEVFDIKARIKNQETTVRLIVRGLIF